VRHVNPNGLPDEVISGDPKPRSCHVQNRRRAGGGGVPPCGLTLPLLAKKWQHLRWDCGFWPLAMKKKLSKAQKIKKLKAQKPGLYRNVALKKLGAGSKKKKAKGYKPPTKKDFARSAKTAKKKY